MNKELMRVFTFMSETSESSDIFEQFYYKFHSKEHSNNVQSCQLILEFHNNKMCYWNFRLNFGPLMCFIEFCVLSINLKLDINRRMW